MTPTAARRQYTWAVTGGFLFVWAVFDQSARLLGSYSGEAGILIAVLVVVAAGGVEVFIFRNKAADTPLLLGLVVPRRAGLISAAGLSACLLAFFPLNAWATGSPIGLRDNWIWLAIGIFAQAGIAEEVLFRGFLFRRFREDRSFWDGAMVAAIPFTAVHLLSFLTLDFSLALASVAVAVSLAFPLAWLYEKSDYSIWPPALLHAVIQGGIKLVVVPSQTFVGLALVWMVLSASLPWLLFPLLRGQRYSAASE